MTIYPSSSAQAAREVVAQRLRDLQKGAGLTVVELAGGCGWHHAKTPRIENARTAPSATDIRLWCRTLGADDQAEDLIAQSLHAESMYTEWRHQVRNGLKQLQDSAVAFFHQTQLFRVYSSSLVPGLLQTEGYAAAVLGMSARFRELPGLRYWIGSPDAMAAQLGHLLTAAPYPPCRSASSRWRRHELWPRETFHLYDDSLVSVELVSGQVRITQSSEITLHVWAFEQMRQTAVYGAAARTLVVKAINALNCP